MRHATDYIGVDIQSSGHDHSESKVDFFWDGNRLPFPDDYFDAVVSFEVFEHIFEPHNVLRELNRVTKRGGSLLISTPFQYGEHEQPYDFARYTSFGLAYILGAGGFEVSHLVKTGSVYMVLGQIIVDVIDHVTPRVPLLGLAFKIILSAPVILASIIFTKIWPPKSEDRYFLNLVVAARKI
jgi:SAM-dependent methyltransferase